MGDRGQTGTGDRQGDRGQGIDRGQGTDREMGDRQGDRHRTGRALQGRMKLGVARAVTRGNQL